MRYSRHLLRGAKDSEHFKMLFDEILDFLHAEPIFFNRKSFFQNFVGRYYTERLLSSKYATRRTSSSLFQTGSQCLSQVLSDNIPMCTLFSHLLTFFSHISHISLYNSHISRTGQNRSLSDQIRSDRGARRVRSPWSDPILYIYFLRHGHWLGRSRLDSTFDQFQSWPSRVHSKSNRGSTWL